MTTGVRSVPAGTAAGGVEPGSVDVHTHLAPALEGGTEGVGPALLRDPAALVAFLDECGTERALVAVPPPFYRQEFPADEAAGWARTLNDGLLAAVADHDRLLPLAHLPLEHPSVALAELDRVLQEGTRADGSGPWAGFGAPAGGLGVDLDASELAEVWARVEAAGLPVVLHPAQTPDVRLQRHYLDNLLGNPVETAVAAGGLLLGGVLERHPGLRVALVHCAGVLPAVLGRWQRGVDTSRPGVDLDAVGAGPRAAARRLFVDTIAHEPGLIDLTLALLGQDAMVFGSDWPFPMGSRPRDELAHLDEATVRRIAVTNAARLLGP